VLNLLAEAYGIGAPTLEKPNSLAAPQATLMASVARGMFGGDLPWGMIAVGAGIGALIIVVDEVLKARKARFRVPVLAAAIGIYLPLELMVPIFIGGLISYAVERWHKVDPTDDDARDRVHRPGTLFAAGLITGEALMGILIAIPIVATGKPDAIAMPASLNVGEIGGLVVLAIVGGWLYRVSTRPAAKAG
jgi:putative OPT family oligopeptide transporter